MIFDRYEPRSNAYRAYNPRTGCIHITRDDVFDELTQWDWSKEEVMCIDL
jgi:hypothetical protein